MKAKRYYRGNDGVLHAAEKEGALFGERKQASAEGQTRADGSYGE